ncbi:hypothetical protein NMY22_g15482 [Coprinellus aureogranulatus]|nr:hypothetical protein NMY22_g15482 [Coprinellus aureogranulatus]
MMPMIFQAPARWWRMHPCRTLRILQGHKPTASLRERNAYPDSDNASIYSSVSDCDLSTLFAVPKTAVAHDVPLVLIYSRLNLTQIGGDLLYGVPVPITTLGENHCLWDGRITRLEIQ